MAEPEQPQEERRANPRVDVRLPARVHMGDEVIEAQTIDMSHDAVLIDGDAFPAGTDFHIEIELSDSGWQRLAAEVVRRHPASPDGTRLAATFAEAASSGGREAIAAFLQRHIDGHQLS